ncbi:MAG: prenyltransferase/squalene oxidase repeat-containing protein, partial [Nannocystaceae bacterium]
MVPDPRAQALSGTPSLAEQARVAYDRALAYLGSRQHADGRVAGEVVWNPMLPCQYVMMCHMLGRPIEPRRAQQVYRSLQVQRRDDGGWGMHPQSDSYLFHTVLGYVALRMLGHEAG